MDEISQAIAKGIDWCYVHGRWVDLHEEIEDLLRPDVEAALRLARESYERLRVGRRGMSAV